MGDVSMQQATQSIRVPLYAEQQSPKYTLNGTGDQLYINCYPEIARNTATGDGEVTIQRRQGFAKKMSLSTHFTGTATPLANVTIGTLDDVNVGAFFDGTANAIRIIQYRPDANTSTLIGSISSANTTGGVSPTVNDEVFITECELVNAGTIYPGIAVSWRKYNSTYSDGFWARSSSGVFSAASLTKISAASFPVTLGKIITGPFQQMNGVFYIMGTNGNIYNSGGSLGTVNDLTEWDALGVIKAQQSIDAGVGVFRYKHHLVAFGRNSIEFFNDIGNDVPASPLGVTEQALIKFGAYSAKHIVNIEDAVYFVGAGNDATNGVFKLDGYTTTKLSSLPIDMALTDTNYTQGKMSLHSFLVNGRPQLLLNRLAFTYMTGTTLPLDTDNIDDITTVDAADFTSTDDTVFIWVYNFSDNTGWWGLNSGVAASDLEAIYPAMQTTYNYPARRQMILMDTFGGAITGSTVFQMSGDAANVGSGQYYDSDGAASETKYAFPTFLRTNKISFNSFARKRIAQAAIEWYVYPVDNTTGNESIYFTVLKDPLGESTVTCEWRRKVLTRTPTRWRNLGQARQFQFIIAYKGRSNFSPKALELYVSQGTK